MNRHRLAAVVWTALLLVACFFPARWMPIAEKKIDSEARRFGIPIDKVVHFGMFAGFAFLWARGERAPIRLLVLGVGIGLAALTESAQNHPSIARDGEVLDALADAVGTLAGVALASAPKVGRTPPQTADPD